MQMRFYLLDERALYYTHPPYALPFPSKRRAQTIHTLYRQTMNEITRSGIRTAVQPPAAPPPTHSSPTPYTAPPNSAHQYSAE
jgi:hypothetical protein